MTSEIERVGQWYSEAEALLLRVRNAAWWRDGLTNRRWVATFAELTREQESELFREANAKADADEDALSAELFDIERATLSIGQSFLSEWLDLFYLELGPIEVPGLPSARCGLIPLQEFCWKVARWGRELLSLNRAQNCREASNAIDFERWLPRACDAIRERLLVERLHIQKELKAKPESSPKQGKTNSEKQGSGGREPKYTDDELLAIAKLWDFFRGNYKSDENKFRGLRSGSIDHFVNWCQRNEEFDCPDTETQAKAMLDAHRKRFPPQKKRKSKIKR